MTEILSLAESAKSASDYFGVLSGNKPELLATGFKPFDDIIGGIAPGFNGVFGAQNGVGKSSAILHAARTSPTKYGIISMEDTPDVLGTRLLSMESGVNGLDIRKGNLDKHARRALAEATERLAGDTGVDIAYSIGKGLQGVLDASKKLVEERGARILVLDYIQKIRGVRDDRNNEVAQIFDNFQGKCFDLGAAGIVVSQLSRNAAMHKRPTRQDLKESGDLENGARFILLAWRSKGADIMNVVVDKSTVGGENTEFAYVRNKNGVLRPLDAASTDPWADM